MPKSDEPELLNPRASVKVAPPPPAEDLSRFILKPYGHRKSLAGAKRGGRASAQQRVKHPRCSYGHGLDEFWRVCWRRKMNGPRLERATGLSGSWLRAVLRGQPARAARAKIIRHLKPAELAVLGWAGKAESGKAGRRKAA